MPNKIKKGSTVVIVEGPQQGAQGKVTQLIRAFDADAKVMRWTVWINGKIKTRLSWVRELV
jgi:ribosomal protein L24